MSGHVRVRTGGWAEAGLTDRDLVRNRIDSIPRERISKPSIFGPILRGFGPIASQWLAGESEAPAMCDVNKFL
jgi:hypothetical protein